MSIFEPVIGLEVHAQLATNSKAWCGCEINPRSLENTKVCEVCSAQPGTLPVLNKNAVNYALKLALSLNCKVNQLSFFDRKNYFYPDLPKGYQITQYSTPIAEEGFILIETDDGQEKKIRIERVQMEEDTGKSQHEGEISLINLNRCGTPLVEIVGKPDLATGTEASSYLKKLHSILTYLDVSKGNMQDGNFRCDVNISLREKGSKKFGTRTEIKNLNSFKNVEKAIEVEIARQTEILTSGRDVIQETLNFDMLTGKIKSLRAKSDAHDYRYFPEPDLLPLLIDDNWINKTKESMPELPDAKKKRFVNEYQIPTYDADVLTTQKELANYFEMAVKNCSAEAKKVSNWIMVELLRLLNESGVSIENSPVSAVALAELLNQVHNEKISGKMAKEVFEKMYDTKKSAITIISEMGISQISDEGQIKELAQKVIKNSPKQIADYLSGKEKLFGYFVGQLMKECGGQANPQLANDVLKEMLDNLKRSK